MTLTKSLCTRIYHVSIDQVALSLAIIAETKLLLQIYKGFTVMYYENTMHIPFLNNDLTKIKHLAVFLHQG